MLVAVLLAVSVILLPVATAQQPLVTSTATPTRLPTYSVVLANDIYVRGGPGSGYLPVGQLGSGDILDPLSISDDGEWVLIAYNRGFGWIRRDLAYWSIDVEALPLYDETDLTPTLVPGSPEPTVFVPTETPEGNWVRAGERGAYLRSGPGIQFPILDSLRGGEPVEPVGRDEAIGWILIRRGDDSFAWISRPLVNWVDDLTTLPVLVNDALTPSATYTYTATFTRTLRPTRTFTPTFTQTSTHTATPTNTATNSLTPSSTPTNTSTHTLTATATSTFTITPSATYTATETNTLSPTPEPSETPLPASSTSSPTMLVPTELEAPATLDNAAVLAVTSANATSEATRTSEPTLTATVAVISTQTNTSSPTASETPTLTPTSTNTLTNTARPATRTSIPASATAEQAESTVTARSSATLTRTATTQSSSTPSRTPTAQATETDTSTPTETHTQGFDAGATATRMLLETAVANNQRTADAASTAALQTSVASSEASEVMPTATLTPTREPSTTPVPVTAAPTNLVTSVPPSTETPESQTSPDSQAGGGIRSEVLVAGLLLLAALIYVALYLRGASRANTYASGFVIERCPVCARGTLYTETRQDRVLGIPRIHFTVRCNECRSVLREVGNNEWRYAVDPTENPELFERWNNRVVTTDQLKGMAAGRRAGLGGRSHVRPRKTPPDNPDVT